MSYMDIRKYGRNPNKGKELSYRFIAHLIGLLLAFESILLLACCCVSMAYNESDLMSFIVSFSICLSASVILSVFGRKKESIPSRYEAYIVVALSWFFFTVFGMFPYLLGGYIPTVTDAFFETMSGFTTTGADILFDNKLVTMVLVFFAAYMSVAFIGWTLLMAFGVGFTEAMSTVISAMGNVGPGLGSFGPAFSWAALPDAAKWLLSSLMLIGRLEIFGFLLIFYRSTWKGSWS